MCVFVRFENNVKGGPETMSNEDLLMLGVRYHFDGETGAVSCNQESNIDNILKEWGYTSCNIAELPMSPSVDLESLPIPEEPNKAVVTTYASLIGQLLYVAINTVSQISYVMSALTRYMTRATEAHLGYNMHLRSRSKHVALRFSFAKILYEMGHIKPLPVASEHQHADIGTKAVGPQILNRHVPVWLGEKMPEK